MAVSVLTVHSSSRRAGKDSGSTFPGVVSGFLVVAGETVLAGLALA
jgi:hypothetical protein